MLRLLIPFIAGILLQWYLPLPFIIFFLSASIALVLLACFFFLPVFKRYKLSVLNGLATSILFISTGSALTWQRNITHNTSWFGHTYQDSATVLVTLDEPLVEKTNSMKAEAAVSGLIRRNQVNYTTGKIIIYIKKDSTRKWKPLSYGSQLILRKPLQEIKNAGNPGGFDYKQYALFHGITHQVTLNPGDYEIMPGRKGAALSKFLYSLQDRILSILRRYIRGEKEAGLAEALLIGYKNDLDQLLVQSYTNTGVVHIVAISGLHLGLIYWLLAILFRPLKAGKQLQWLPPLLIIVCLWLFSLLAGAQPSVLRSALMFTCIVAGQSLSRKTNIYNTLAFSAFVLLCYNPFWLWDIGFQLSYAALLSIVIFLKPIYHLFAFKNKWIDSIWKMNAVTLAAQVLTLPFCLYYFHQFPNYFLLTNFIAVPLSSIILIAEILLCAMAAVPALAVITGLLVQWLIILMNGIIEKTGSLPFPVWDGIQINIWQAILLVIIAAAIGYWLICGSIHGLKMALAALFGFVTLRSISFIECRSQQKLIIYNIPFKTAIEFIDGFHYSFAGDSLLASDEVARRFYFRPSHILHRVQPAAVNSFVEMAHCFKWNSQYIIWADRSFSISPVHTGIEKPVIDLLILSKNARVYIDSLNKSFAIKQVVFDSSVPASKMNYWKKDCDSLHIPWYDVNTKGAFAINLQ